MNITLYQTLEDRDNPDEIERDGPFLCSHNKAWLGEGFYFWDTYIQLGHWWGGAVYPNGYVICKALAVMDENCWDLHGNGNHRLEFEEACEELVKRKITSKSKLLVPQVITYLKKIGIFTYTSIRALGTDSVSPNYNNRFFIYRINFRTGNKSFLDLRPAVQICLLEKRALSLKRYSIVYPDHYIDNSFT